MLPALFLVLFTIHNGNNEDLNVAYNTIQDWITANRYQIDGPVREVNPSMVSLLLKTNNNIPKSINLYKEAL